MNKEQILNAFRSLAQSQGYYGRLLNAINENPEQGEKYLAELERQNFKDMVELVMFIEE